MAVYTDVSDDELGLPRRLRPRRPVVLQGHRRGRRELELPARTPSAASTSSRSTRSGSRPADLPFFLGLMEHLAARGITCPLPVHEPRAARRSAGSPAGRRRSSPSSTACGCGGRAPSIAPRSARRWRGCISPARTSPLQRAQRAVGRRLAAALRRLRGARRRGAARPRATRSSASSTILEANWPHGPAGGRHPRRPLPRQRVLPRRQAVGPDRLLFRLQRHARLRRRGLPQRLVLRARRLAQRHQGARAARGLQRARGRFGAAEIAALPLLARGAALRFLLTRLYDWLDRAAGRAGAAEGPARIFPQAPLPPGGRERRATTGSSR